MQAPTTTNTPKLRKRKSKPKVTATISAMPTSKVRDVHPQLILCTAHPTIPNRMIIGLGTTVAAQGHHLTRYTIRPDRAAEPTNLFAVFLVRLSISLYFQHAKTSEGGGPDLMECSPSPDMLPLGQDYHRNCQRGSGIPFYIHLHVYI